MRIDKGRRVKRITEEIIQKAIKYAEQGIPTLQIQELLGFDRTHFARILKSRGVKIRRQGQSARNNFQRNGRKSDTSAIARVSIEIRAGRLIRPDNCQFCRLKNFKTKSGRSYIHAHHCDYNKPLDVIWLCKKCHHEWHRKYEAIPKMSIQLGRQSENKE